MVPEHVRLLRKLGACSEAVKFAKKYPTIRQAWNHCDNGAWLFWLVLAVDSSVKTRCVLGLRSCGCCSGPARRVRDEFTVSLTEMRRAVAQQVRS